MQNKRLVSGLDKLGINGRWQSRLFVAVLAGTIILLTALGLYARQMTSRHAQMIHAIHEIMLKCSAAHLYYEEVINGDLHVESDRIWASLDKAQRYVNALLNGGSDGESRLLPVSDPEIHVEIEKIQHNLNGFRQAIAKRLNPEGGAIVSQNVSYDDVTHYEVMKHAEQVEAILFESIKKEIRLFNGSQMIILLVTILFAFIVSLHFQRYERRQRFNIQEMDKSKRNLEKSNTWLATILESIGDGIITTDMEGKVTTINQAAVTLTGWSKGEAEHKNINQIFQIIDEKSRQPITNQVETISNDIKVSVGHTAILIAKDGTETPILRRITSINEQGHQLGAVVIFRDISMFVEKEMELRQSEGLYRSLVENIDLGITLIDKNNNVLMANTAQGKMFERSHLEFLGKKCHQEFENRSEPCAHCLGPLAMETGTPQEFEAQGTREDGNVINVRIRVFPVFDKPAGKATRFIEVVEDVTHKKNTERELVEERDKAHNLLKELSHNNEIMEKIFATTEFSLAYLDKEFNFIRVNRAYADAARKKTEFFIGKNHFDLYPDSEIQGIFHSVVVTGIPFSVVAKPFTYPDQPELGTTFWDWTLQPVNDGEGKVEGLILALSEVTERKLSEDKLLQAQKLESLGTLAGGIAHDFNNLLTSIQGFTSLVMSDLPEDSETYSYLDQVMQAGHRATDLVKQILSFSRDNDQELRPLQLQSIVKEVLKLLRGTLPSTIEISHKINNQYSPILANSTQIHQVIMNLCTNAYHAMMEHGGKLEVKLEELAIDSGQACRVQNLLTGRYLKLSISDTGHGIDELIIDRIFEPYFSTKKEGEGTGLGLSTTYGIIMSHGGAISVESQVGKGTTFHLYFPVAEHEYIETAEVREDEPLPNLNLRVLFVDDLEFNVLLGKEVLGRTGCEVIGQTNSLEALNLFGASPDQFDLVITDQTMPNLTGFELAKRMLAIRPDIPIIMLTGHSDIMDEKKAKTIGIKEFIMKPLDFKMLVKAVSKVVH